MEQMENNVSLYEQVFLQKNPGETLHPGGLALTQYALDLCALQKGSRILDLGCGAGSSVQYLHKRGYAAVGVDLSALLLQAGYKRNSSLSFLQGDAGFLPLSSGQMDAILIECSLSVFPDPDKVLQECQRILRKEGLLILTDLYSRNPSGLPDLQAHFPSSCLANSMIQEKLLKQLSKHGFLETNWEDHSEVMKSFSGQSVLQSFACTAEQTIDSLEAFLTIVHARLGYFLCIAKKC